MSDDYKIQINTNVNGDLINLRATSGEELNDVIGGFAEHSEGIFKSLGDVKQAALVNGVFTGNASAATSSAPRAAVNSAPGAIPSCPDHGEMKDMRGKRNKQGQPYKNRFYCKNFGCKTPGQGEWIE